mmetsp:Transcript_28796/g.44234  ORF Transcript_28796/g.44234 Transcript_28796/m.44234 type:complete len:81 (-) Transcript_28796:1120-1362(-)
MTFIQHFRFSFLRNQDIFKSAILSWGIELMNIFVIRVENISGSFSRNNVKSCIMSWMTPSEYVSSCLNFEPFGMKLAIES